MSRLVFHPPPVQPSGACVRFDTASGSSSKVGDYLLLSLDGTPILSTINSDGVTGALPAFLGPNDGTATLYMKTLNGAGTVTATVAVTGTTGGTPAAPASSTDVAAAVAALVNGAPSDRDSFGEVAGLLAALSGTYAPLASPAFTGSPTVNGLPLGTGALPNQTTVLQPSGDTTGATDQAAVAAAITALLAKTVAGGTLLLGAGDWYWNSQQIDIYTVPARLKIMGQGQATRIHSTATGTAGTAKALFYVYGGGQVAPLPVLGNSGAVGRNWIDISDVELIGNGSSCGIAYDGVYQGRISNVVGHGFTATTKYGTPFYVNWAIDVEVDNVVSYSNYNGLYIQGNANNIIGGWFLINTNCGVLVDSLSGGNTFLGSVFQGNTVAGIDILSSQNIRLASCWIEGNAQVGARVRGISNSRSNVVLFDSPYITGPGIVVGSCADNVMITAPVNTGVGVTLAITAGARNVVVEDPPTGMSYSQVQDGTLGTEFSFRRGKAAVSTVTASGTAQTIPTPLVADRSVITLTANCAFTFPVPAKGRILDLTLTQDGTGSRTVTWPTNVAWPAGTTPTLTTTSGHSDRFRFTSDDGVYWMGRQLGLDYNPTSASGPLSVTGLLAWFDATRINSLDASRLTSWPDLTRAGRDLLQETFTSQPMFYSTTPAKLVNGKPAVWFSGSSMVSQVIGSTSAQPVTVYIVCYPTSLTGSPYLFDGSPRQAIFAGSNFFSAFAGSQIDGTASSAAANNRYILTAVFNGASSVLRSNGTQVASGNTGSNGFASMTLGARAADGVLNFTGAICEVLVYSGAHSGGTLTAIESYLGRW